MEGESFEATFNQVKNNLLHLTALKGSQRTKSQVARVAGHSLSLKARHSEDG